jgi:hypothetical protein
MAKGKAKKRAAATAKVGGKGGKAEEGEHEEAGEAGTTFASKAKGVSTDEVRIANHPTHTRDVPRTLG